MKISKNISFLLESYAYARSHLNFTLPLVIIGDGHDMKNIRLKIDSLNLQSNVKLLGLLENPFPWIKKAEIFTLTSKAEGLPTVVLESLACHTKIVSTRSKGGIKDIMIDELEEYLVNFDIKDFAQKMLKTINEKKTIEFDNYTERFSPKAIVKHYIELM